MFKSIIFIALITANVIASSVNTIATTNFLGTVRTINGVHAASLLSYHHVITAATSIVRQRGSTSDYVIQEGTVNMGSPIIANQNKKIDFFENNVRIFPLFSLSLRRHDIAIIILDYAFIPSPTIAPIGIIEPCMILPPIGTVMHLAVGTISPHLVFDMELHDYFTESSDRSISFDTPSGQNSGITRGNPIIWNRFNGNVIFSLSINNTINPVRRLNGILLLDYSDWILYIIESN